MKFGQKWSEMILKWDVKVGIMETNCPTNERYGLKGQSVATNMAMAVCLK